jgi:hypothetical protein
MIKFAIVERDDPWVVWDKIMWKHYKDGKEFRCVQSLDEADVIIWNTQVDKLFTEDQFTDDQLAKVLPYVTDPENFYYMEYHSKVLIDNPAIDYTISKYTSETIRFTKPVHTNINVFPGDWSGNILTICDAGHEKSNMHMLIRAALRLQTEEEDIIGDIDIFSHTDIKMEPFNNINFWGFQSPKKIDSVINDKSPIIVYTSDIERQPTTLLSYIEFVPCIAIRNSITMEYPFMAYFSNEEELYELLKELHYYVYGGKYRDCATFDGTPYDSEDDRVYAQFENALKEFMDGNGLHV